MNKLLISLPALAAAALMGASGAAVAGKASKPKLAISGYAVHGIEWVNNGDVGGANTGGLNQMNDSELTFKGSGTMDNGVKVTARFDLEGSATDEDGQMDDMWMTISGSFGQILLGEHDGASMKMVTGYQGSWATALRNLPFERGEIVPAPSGFGNVGPNFSTRNTLSDSDDPKVTYISPRFGGLQVGASYMRDAGRTSTDTTTSQTPNAGAQDYYAFAANFSQNVGGAKLGVAGGYLQEFTNAIGDTQKAYVAGLTVESGPFKIAFGFNRQDDPTVTNAAGQASGAASKDGQSYSVGTRYKSGAHSFSVAVFKGETAADTTVAGDDESTTLWFSHSLALGPGVKITNALGHTNWDGEGSGVAEDQSGWGASTSVKVSF